MILSAFAVLALEKKLPGFGNNCRPVGFGYRDRRPGPDRILVNLNAFLVMPPNTIAPSRPFPTRQCLLPFLRRLLIPQLQGWHARNVWRRCQVSAQLDKQPCRDQNSRNGVYARDSQQARGAEPYVLHYVGASKKQNRESMLNSGSNGANQA